MSPRPEETELSLGRDGAVYPLRAMLESLDRASLAEVERAMGLTLHPPATPKEKRLGELGFLASLVNREKLPAHLTFAVVERESYDAIRPDSAPRSARLVARYGSWRRACFHAYGLLSDGRWRGPSNPWPMHLQGKTMPRDYERHEIRAALRECAFALCVRPSSSTFFQWVATKRARALERGLSLRLPSQQSLYNHFPGCEGGFNAAIADAEILDDELDEAWHTRLGVEDPEDLTPEDYINAMPVEELVAAGLSMSTARQLKQRSLRKDQPKAATDRSFSASDIARSLPLSDALRLAVWVGCSLEWLAGLTRRGGVPPNPATIAGARLATNVLRVRRVELDIAEAALRKSVALQLGPYRRLLNGQREPTIGEVADLARTLRLDVGQLITS